MNVKKLIGLAAIVLGGMTSCSNILEEDGVSNVITKGETGELRLNLVTDGTLNVTTKSTDEEVIANALKGIDKNYFSINGIGKTETQQFSGTAKEFSSGKIVPTGMYTITAEKNFDTKNQRIDFGIPHFKGEIANVNVEANDKTDPYPIEVKLINSIISVNTSEFTKLKNDANITELYVEDPEDNQTYDLLEAENTLKGLSDYTKILFVNSSVTNVNMVIKGTVEDGTKEFTNTKQITLTYEEDKPKNYSVSYNISKENGTLILSINVNGEVTKEDLTETIDPYNPTPSQES